MTWRLRFLASMVSATVLLGSLSTAYGAVLWYEPFDYAAGTSVADHGPWADSDAGQGSSSTIIDAAGLTYPGLPTSGGSGTMTGNSNHPVNTTDSSAGGPSSVNWNDTDAGTFYMSILMKSTNMDFWHNPFGMGSIMQQRSDHVFIDTPDTPGSQSVNQESPNGADTADLIVLRVTAPASSGDTNGKQELLVNPTLPITDEAAAFAGAAVIDFWPNGGSDRFVQFSRSPSGGQAWFDEIRIATTLDEALGVPEPASLTLMGLAALLPLLVLRRRR